MDQRQRQWVEQRLGAIERIVEEVRRYLAAAADAMAPAPEPGFLAALRRMGAFLNDVEQAGGRLSKAQLLALAARHGYDPRGTAGFYSGQQPSLRLHPDGTRELTEAGRQRAREWRETFGQAA